MKAQLEQLLDTALRQLGGSVLPATSGQPSIGLERARDARHGDFVSPIAMHLAKATGKEPRALAQAIVAALPESPLLEKAEVAAAGFINLHLHPRAYAQVIEHIHQLGDACGRCELGCGRRAEVGIVLPGSADLLSVTHARYATYAAALANVLAMAGFDVHRAIRFRRSQQPHTDQTLAAVRHDLEALGIAPGEWGFSHAFDASTAGADAIVNPEAPVSTERAGVAVRFCAHPDAGTEETGTLQSLSIQSAKAGAVRNVRELRERIGPDACRFFLLLRHHDQPLDIDLALATTRTIGNPLYLVQYAHARVASTVKEMRARGYSIDLADGIAHIGLLTTQAERVLLAELSRFPEVIAWAATNCAPHTVVYYLRDVATAFHTYYNAEKWIVTEAERRNARVALVLAAGQVVRNGLSLIGVSAPESM